MLYQIIGRNEYCDILYILYIYNIILSFDIVFFYSIIQTEDQTCKILYFKVNIFISKLIYLFPIKLIYLFPMVILNIYNILTK
jgi:hypothetical protein